MKLNYVTVEKALEHLTKGSRVVTSMASAEASGFWNGLTNQKDVEDILVYCANPTKDYGCFSEAVERKLTFVVMFLTSVMKTSYANPFVTYPPQHLSNWARNILSAGEVDVFWGSCSGVDERGFVSLGSGCCYESEMITNAKKVVLEVNENMPVTYGSTTVHINQVDCFIDNTHDLPVIPRPQVSEIDKKIAANVAQLIENGSTLQLGIGGVPNALAMALESHEDLGIHTEMINDTMMDLVKSGAVNGSKKSIWPHKIVGSFAYGTKELYDFMNKNPMFELHPSSVVNDPYRMGRNHKMVSVNTAVEVDITGQVCSESIGHREISGIGGASETHIGAQRSVGGRGIIAMPSMSKKGQSKITFELLPGAKVSISRNDIDTVVTEYGVAQLRGRSTRERVLQLIAISHPSVRDQLTKQAKAHLYI